LEVIDMLRSRRRKRRITLTVPELPDIKTIRKNFHEDKISDVFCISEDEYFEFFTKTINLMTSLGNDSKSLVEFCDKMLRRYFNLKVDPQLLFKFTVFMHIATEAVHRALHGITVFVPVLAPDLPVPEHGKVKKGDEDEDTTKRYIG
jgi:hypothetical protein